MLDKVIHTVLPVAVVVCATVLVAMRRVDSATGVILISAAGGYGAVAVGAAGRKPPPG